MIRLMDYKRRCVGAAWIIFMHKLQADLPHKMALEMSNRSVVPVLSCVVGKRGTARLV